MNVPIWCNKCDVIQSDEVKKTFLLFECLHVFCSDCVKDDIERCETPTKRTVKCFVCSRVVSFTVIKKDMNPRQRMLFMDLGAQLDIMKTRLTRMFFFQCRQKEILHNNMVNRIKSNMVKVQNLEANVENVEKPSSNENDEKDEKDELEKAKATLKQKTEMYEALKKRCQMLKSNQSSVSGNSSISLSVDSTQYSDGLSLERCSLLSDGEKVD